MSKKNEVNISGTLEKNRVIAHLENLAKSLKDSTMYIQQGNEFVSLTPAAHMEFDLEAEQKKNKESLTVKISWKKIESVGLENDILISSDKPVIAVSETNSQNDE
jgi:amphi-Trp domain-containing protein